MTHLTLIGPVFIPRRGDKPAGRAVCFMTLLSALDRMGITYKAVDSNPYNHIPKIGRLLSALWVMSNAKRLAMTESVSFHGAGAGIVGIGSRLLRYTKKNGKRLSIRVFGGAFKSYYDAAHLVEKQQIEDVLRNVDAVFFETRQTVEFFKELNPNTYWFPNNRPTPDLRVRRVGDYARKVRLCECRLP